MVVESVISHHDEVVTIAQKLEIRKSPWRHVVVNSHHDEQELRHNLRLRRHVA